MTAAAKARIAELEAQIRTDNSAVIAALQRKLEPMPPEEAYRISDEWYDADERGYDLIRRVEAWHEQR